jgi:hypothetical protein
MAGGTIRKSIERQQPCHQDKYDNGISGDGLFELISTRLRLEILAYKNALATSPWDKYLQTRDRRS